jgi:hypothetical protein
MVVFPHGNDSNRRAVPRSGRCAARSGGCASAAAGAAHADESRRRARAAASARTSQREARRGHAAAFLAAARNPGGLLVRRMVGGGWWRLGFGGPRVAYAGATRDRVHCKIIQPLNLITILLIYACVILNGENGSKTGDHIRACVSMHQAILRTRDS